MEFLLIGDSKLKVILNEEEVRAHKLDTLSEGGGHSSRRSFWKILEKAKSEVQFDTSGDKVLIQFYPLKNGGCEVFVTKLGILSDTSAKIVAKSDKVTMLSKRKNYYAFKNFSDLVCACNAVMRVSDGNAPESTAYTYAEGFFLSVDEYGKGGESSEFPSLSEFGKWLTTDMALFISEHGTKLACENAVKILSADGVKLSDLLP